jgi:hypothetical protein
MMVLFKLLFDTVEVAIEVKKQAHAYKKNSGLNL